MISTESEAAAGVLENDQQLVGNLLKIHNIDCEEDQTPSYGSEDEDVDIYDNSEWDKYDTIERQLYPSRSRGYKDNLKYTINVNKSKNLYRLVTLNPAAESKPESKNFRRFDLSVKNRQKKNMSNEKLTNNRICSECKENVDAYALFIIQKIIDRRLLKSVDYLLEVGPRSYSFHANCNSFDLVSLGSKEIPSNLPEECTVKIFRENCESYPDDKTSNKTRQLCGEREWANLRHAWDIIPCPQPIYHKHHVVVLSFIGSRHKLAPKIKFVTFTREEYIMIYYEIVESMRALYAEANVIHGNLSEYSILWHNRKCYFVDFDQSLQPHEDAAFDALFMDCTNISKFFRSVNVPDMYTTNGLFAYITGCSYKDKISLAKLQVQLKKSN